MIVSINQPAYLPWLGYFHRIAISDLHIVLDHVQFEKNSFVNRNKVRTPDGSCWVSVPVKTKGQFGNLAIHSLEINNQTKWRTKHWKTLTQYYSKTPYFKDHQDFFEAFYNQEWTHLLPLCIAINDYILKALNIQTPIQYSSQLNPQLSKSELVHELCLKSKATTYLSGILGKDYLNESLFEASNIQVQYQNYKHPNYLQKFEGFQPYMSILDLLFNHGKNSFEILMKGNPQ